jgi:enoyl-CoA hydratase/carnithine racemase
MPEELVAVQIHDCGVVELALNRPEALNAISVAVATALVEAAERVVAAGASVVVVTSRSPKAFSVGADLKERSAMTAAELIDCRPRFRAAYRALLDLPMPVLAALHGFAVGGGLELALTCDLIVADRTARVGLPEVRIGLIPGGGGTQLLARRAGWGPAAQLVLTGQSIEAEDALHLGIVDRLVDAGEDRAAALEIARQMSSASPSSLRLAKQALRDGWSLRLEDGLDLEDRLWRQTATSADREEGIRAFVEKRSPRWPSAKRSRK